MQYQQKPATAQAARVFSLRRIQEVAAGKINIP
jgi:hypothetical protein